ncbi:MAG: regulatory protein RecX [Lachnospiraceae bacterium]|nr:regulatory protein RecX [Lachnospiraceae bacterium]
MYRKLPRPPREPRMIRMSDQTRGMTVTGIEPYPKGKGRVSVYLNDEFAFVLYKGELSQYSLDEGARVDGALYRRILNETIIPRAKKRGMNLLKTMDRTEADIRRRLSEGGYPGEAVDATVDYLKSFHYIDDLRYAIEYIRCKIATTSVRMIKSKLLSRGIVSEIVDQAITAYSDESGEDTGETEVELIRTLMAKRCSGDITEIDYTSKQKLFAYLYQKGFSMSDIEKAYRTFEASEKSH